MCSYRRRSPPRTKPSLYPFIPYYCHRKKNGQPYGRVLRLIDPNREINSPAGRSAVHAEQPPLDLRTRGAIRDRNALATELAHADGQVELENGKFDKFMLHQNQDIGQANLQMLQEAKGELQRLAGEDYLAPRVRCAVGRVSKRNRCHTTSPKSIFSTTCGVPAK